MLTNQQAATLFKAFAARPDLFAAKPATYRKAAIDVVIAQLKEKDCGLDTARRIAAVVGHDALLAVFDEQPTTLTTGLVTKFDKAMSARAKAEGAWARAHLAALIEGSAEPAPPTAKPKIAPAPKKSNIGTVRALRQARSMGGE